MLLAYNFYLLLRSSIFYFEIGNSGYILSLLTHDNVHGLRFRSDPLLRLMPAAVLDLRLRSAPLGSDRIGPTATSSVDRTISNYGSVRATVVVKRQ